ncbi:MAG: Unknown protein [uncultured Sulfurovum sp.]|uniref:Uncharacterized protein n=1 Tax=uncultured Sulfurovum sp. TaxID=269237 RepID=A0A6S6SZ54_9BACT|nr:MAG: Unknown protein [uncultured Sulfurovum sp.]
MDFLDKLRNHEGLIDTEHIIFDNNGYMHIEEQLVEGLDEIKSIIDILKHHPYLWSNSKFHLQKHRGRRCGASAPIIAIPSFIYVCTSTKTF